MLLDTYIFKLPSGALTNQHHTAAFAALWLPGAVALEDTLEVLDMGTFKEVRAAAVERQKVLAGA